MKKKSILWLALIVLVAISSYFVWNTQKANVYQEKEIIKIGVILPLSGERAAFGQTSKKGIDLAIKEINSDKNNDTKISLTFEDSQSSAQRAVSAFYKLINDEIRIVVGPISSQEVLAIAPVAESKKIILFSPGASSPKITNAGEYILRNVPSDIYEGSLMANFAYDSLNIRRVAIIYNNSDYGIGVEEVFANEFKKRGGEIFSIGYSDINDYRTLLQKAKNENPEAIYFIGYTELGTIVKQAREIGFKCQFLSTAIFEDTSILKTASTAAEGIIFTSITFDINNPSPRAQNFIKSYKEIYKDDPDGYAAVAYDAIYIISEAIKLSKENKCSVKDALYKTRAFPALLGTLSFDKNGDVILPITVKTVKNGEFKKF